jgi:hypothetical protein
VLHVVMSEGSSAWAHVPGCLVATTHLSGVGDLLTASWQALQCPRCDLLLVITTTLDDTAEGVSGQRRPPWLPHDRSQ